MTESTITPHFRPAHIGDVDALFALEEASFSNDKLSRRRFQHWVNAVNGVLLLAEDDRGLLAYGLVLLHKGTRLARLYSLAVAQRSRGMGLGRSLLEKLEQAAAAKGRLYMRLEVEKNNTAAICLYERMGYQTFGEYSDYYEDHGDALRMQKRIRFASRNSFFQAVNWYQQTTDFTCGPAALMMAMNSIDKKLKPDQLTELDIWRESTTIFMTSGHGGCHPVGLALAASRRGFSASVYLNTDKPLFTDSVRSQHKKDIMRTVDRQFHAKAKREKVSIYHREVTQQQIEAWLQKGHSVIILISTYRLDGRKAPHWVTVTSIDDTCLYVHDPDLDEKNQVPLDCQHIPIARDDFAKMSAFGSQRLRTAIVIRKKAAAKNISKP
ncbi:MAG: GNAT family N-acetyltransferase/peptidase C39 family protein [Pseudomonadales bacterium]|nr:GNAT family N-acetyltransferase/peptidase C39 family protein [Pseudomonadales bacterium]